MDVVHYISIAIVRIIIEIWLNLYLNRSISKDNPIEIVPFYYMFYLLRMYDIHGPYERHFKINLISSFQMVLRAQHVIHLYNVFYSFNVSFSFCTGFNTEAIWAFVMQS